MVVKTINCKLANHRILKQIMTSETVYNVRKFIWLNIIPSKLSSKSSNVQPTKSTFILKYWQVQEYQFHRQYF